MWSLTVVPESFLMFNNCSAANLLTKGTTWRANSQLAEDAILLTWLKGHPSWGHWPIHLVIFTGIGSKSGSVSMIEDDAIADGRSAAAGASHIFLRVALEFGRHASSPLLSSAKVV